MHGVQFKKKAPYAVKAIKELASKNMWKKDVRIDPELNKELWRNGIRNLPTRVDVCWYQYIYKYIINIYKYIFIYFIKYK